MDKQLNDNFIREITPLSEKDCFYIADRHKKEFTYPMHSHREFELNFVVHAPGVRRIVGDSAEVIGDYDLVLITSPDLEHVWEQNTCTSSDIREITIQFVPAFMSGLIDTNQFDMIRKMLDKAQYGLCFPIDAVMKVYSLIEGLLCRNPFSYAALRVVFVYRSGTDTVELVVCKDTSPFGQSAGTESAGLHSETLSGRNQVGKTGRHGRHDGGFFQPFLQVAYGQESVRLYYRPASGTRHSSACRFNDGRSRNLL